MVMTNVNDCDFIICSSFEYKIVTINVPIDINFCKSLLLNLKFIYYEDHEIHKSFLLYKGPYTITQIFDNNTVIAT